MSLIDGFVQACTNSSASIAVLQFVIQLLYNKLWANKSFKTFEQKISFRGISHVATPTLIT